MFRRRFKDDNNDIDTVSWCLRSIISAVYLGEILASHNNSRRLGFDVRRHRPVDCFDVDVRRNQPTACFDVRWDKPAALMMMLRLTWSLAVCHSAWKYQLCCMIWCSFLSSYCCVTQTSMLSFGSCFVKMIVLRLSCSLTLASCRC